MMRIQPRCYWFTGLSGAGKSTLCAGLQARLEADGCSVVWLDGDVLRAGLCADLGFGDDDRRENIRRVSEVAKVLLDAGIVVLVSLISPFESDRQRVRERLGRDRFVEVYVDAPLGECERRDVKGLYVRARRGEIPSFTGLSSPYEAPLRPDIHLRTMGAEVDEQVDLLVAHAFRQ